LSFIVLLGLSRISNIILNHLLGEGISALRHNLGQGCSKFRIALILGHLELDILGDIPLELLIDLAVVKPRPEGVQVEVLIDKLNVAAGKLQHGQADDLVVRGGKPLPLLVLQVALFDLPIEVYAEGAQMGYLLRDVPVEVVGLLILGVGHRPPVLHQVVHDPVLQCDRVRDGGLLELVDCVIDLEDLPTDQLVIAIHEEADLLRTAVVHDGGVDVGDGGDSLLIDDQSHPLLINIVLPEEAVDEEGGVVGAGVVDDDDVVVGVLLVEDGLQVELEAEGLGVVVGGHDDAEGQLLLVTAQVVGLLQPALLLLEELLHLPPLVGGGEGSPEIGLLHQPVIPPHLVAEVGVVGKFLELPHPLLPNALLHLVLQLVQQDVVVRHIALQPIQPFLVSQLD
jgi:hypothetical protein